MPKPSSLLSQEQKNGSEFFAEDIYEQTWDWLKIRGCEALISPRLIEQYAMSVARWMQCEDIISRFGFLSKHPTTGNPIASPYISMSQTFLAQANRIWSEIFSVVRENCTTNYRGPTPADDVMERLLRYRK